MANLNIKVALTKIPGAKVMDIQGKTTTRKCVVIPIDNELGTVIDSYHHSDGVSFQGEISPRWKKLQDVWLNLIGMEFKEQRHGQSHGIKANISRSTLAKMSEDDIRSTPIIGNIQPWANDFYKEDNDKEEEDW